MTKMEEEFIKRKGVTKCEEFVPFFMRDRNSLVSKAYSDDRVSIKPTFLGMFFMQGDIEIEIQIGKTLSSNAHTTKYVYVKNGRKVAILEKGIKAKIAKGIWVVKK